MTFSLIEGLILFFDKRKRVQKYSKKYEIKHRGGRRGKRGGKKERWREEVG